MNIRSLVLHGFRSWQRASGVALLAVGALALGIGTTTAIYTAVQTVLLWPPPSSIAMAPFVSAVALMACFTIFACLVPAVTHGTNAFSASEAGRLPRAPSP